MIVCIQILMPCNACIMSLYAHAHIPMVSNNNFQEHMGRMYLLNFVERALELTVTGFGSSMCCIIFFAPDENHPGHENSALQI